MEKRIWKDRFKVSCDPRHMEGFANEDSFWNESEASVMAGLAWGREKARLLKWVRKQMQWRLTPRQRQGIELYYFKNLTYYEVGQEMGCTTSSASRSIERGIHRLRVAARNDPPALPKPRRRRRRRP